MERSTAAKDAVQDSDAIAYGLTADQINALTQYISINIERRITPADLALLIGVGRNTFGRRFHQSFGMTPMRFLKDARTIMARRLFVETNTPLNDFARQCGFTYSSHLNRVFSAAYGMSPRRWRLCLRI